MRIKHLLIISILFLVFSGTQRIYAASDATPLKNITILGFKYSNTEDNIRKIVEKNHLNISCQTNTGPIKKNHPVLGNKIKTDWVCKSSGILGAQQTGEPWASLKIQTIDGEFSSVKYTTNAFSEDEKQELHDTFVMLHKKLANAEQNDPTLKPHHYELEDRIGITKTRIYKHSLKAEGSYPCGDGSVLLKLSADITDIPLHKVKTLEFEMTSSAYGRQCD